MYTVYGMYTPELKGLIKLVYFVCLGFFLSFVLVGRFVVVEYGYAEHRRHVYTRYLKNFKFAALI